MIKYKILDKRLYNYELYPVSPDTYTAGLDLRAMLDVQLELLPGESLTVGTGMAIHIDNPMGCGLILPRSGTGSKGLVLGNSVGLIDPDYQGELKLSLYNRLVNTPITVHPGDRVAQLVIVPFVPINLQLVAEFDSVTERGEKGFGSTGVR